MRKQGSPAERLLPDEDQNVPALPVQEVRGLGEEYCFREQKGYGGEGMNLEWIRITPPVEGANPDSGITFLQALPKGGDVPDDVITVSIPFLTKNLSVDHARHAYMLVEMAFHSLKAHLEKEEDDASV